MTKLQMKLESNIGTLFLIASEHALHGVFWEQQRIPMVNGSSTPTEKFLNQAAREITEYLNGTRRDFDLPLAPEGTEFQKRVWEELTKIPYGQTRSYKDIATALNDPKASRAVGTANGLNPLCIIVPCHRVISSDGTIGGYSAGLAIKKRLLDLEATRN
jgi:methylated-DNA-[protein]-cysteine S-methyltransferase